MGLFKLPRRQYLGLLAASATVGLLSACSHGTNQLAQAATATAGGAKGTPQSAASPAGTPVKAATPKPTATPGVLPVPMPTGATKLTIWFHWGGKQGDEVQSLINKYNTTQGKTDKLYVSIQTVDPSTYLEKMTAAKIAGDTPDVYSNSVPAKILGTNQIAIPFPTEESQYVQKNYIAGSVELVTFKGQVWGFPTEYQAPAYLYRKSLFQKAGIESPPKSIDDEYQDAVKLTVKSGGKTTLYGYTLWYDNYPITQLASLIARFGGQMYSFEGERPVKVDVVSQQAVEAVKWWQSLVTAGATQVAQMPYTDAWSNGLAATTEIEVWFPIFYLRDGGREDIWNDLGGQAVQPKSGVNPIVYAGGWQLSVANGSKNVDHTWPFLHWMMYKPDMPFSHFIVEQIGAIPSPTDYPKNIPGWSDAVTQAYLVDTAPISRGNPERLVLGAPQIDKAVEDMMQAIFLGKEQLESGLQKLNTQLNGIIKRTDTA